jgi:hypothetical protein
VTETLAYLLCVPGIPLAAFFVWLVGFARKSGNETRLPFLQMPRPAGWSLQMRCSELMEKIQFHLLLALFSGVFFAYVASVAKAPPAISLSLGMLASCAFLYHVGRLFIRYRNHRLGLIGEQVVGRLLDQIACDTIKVFHDLEVRDPGGKPWNIDHVVVTPVAVFAIETKTRRKPKDSDHAGKAGYKVIFDGTQLLFPSPMRANRYGLKQAQENANWLSSKLTTLNGRPIPVTPVLVMPGWWVDRRGKGPVSVLNAKELPNFLSRRGETLSAQDQSAIAAQLEERCQIDLSQPA